jgi:hypothetical protein
MSLDAKFFRKAKRVNRAVEITDTEAIIPAVKDSPEIRVALPNRRLVTFDERKEKLDARNVEISAIEEQIELERKKLMALTKTYKEIRSGVAEIVVQNQKVKELMERRSALSHPEVWIESIKGLTLKDIFESKRDTRKVADNSELYQVKRRVEPISSLYVDVGVAAAAAVAKAEGDEAAEIDARIAAEARAKAAKTAAAIAATAAAPPKPSAQAAQGAIIGKRVIKIKKTPAPPV